MNAEPRIHHTSRKVVTKATWKLEMYSATLDDLRQFVEQTVHLPAGTPIVTGFLGADITVTETHEEDTP